MAASGSGSRGAKSCEAVGREEVVRVVPFLRASDAQDPGKSSLGAFTIGRHQGTALLASALLYVMSN